MLPERLDDYATTIGSAACRHRADRCGTGRPSTFGVDEHSEADDQPTVHDTQAAEVDDEQQALARQR